MNEIEWLKSLDRRQAAPVVDVRDGVLREIRLRRTAPMTDEIAPLAAIIAALAGGGVAVLAVQAWMSMLDPLASLVEPLRMVLQ